MRTSFVLSSAARVATLAFAWMLVASCGANSTDGSTFGNGTGGSGGTVFPGGSGGTSALDSGPGEGGLTEAGACTGDSFPGKLVPLDVYVLLDATASMNGAQGTPVVWPSVTSALNSIISDPKTEGIGMGLTYLPVPPPPGFVVPGSCKTNADCPGNTGPCEAITIGLPKTCSNACTVATQEQDCGLYGTCMPMMQKKICNGAMVPKVSCDPVDYGQPVVPIDTLPANKNALSTEINGKDPDGDATPTQPSLEGALTYAKQWAVDHPTHLVHVLFATDGLPNDCTFNSIQGAADVAKQYFEGNPSVPTFVLGIGELSDLNAIASSGGTDKAYLADSSSVAQKMVDMFNEIRANGACKFQIPAPAPGKTLNYDYVRVSYTPIGETNQVDVYQVKDAADCDPTTGGWYYDSDPKVQNPSKILLCPATCEQVKLSDEGVTVMLGCLSLVK